MNPQATSSFPGPLSNLLSLETQHQDTTVPMQSVAKYYSTAVANT